MVRWKIVYTKQAEKDSQKIVRHSLKEKTARLLAIIEQDPFQKPPEFEKLIGKYDVYSRRINIRHRLVYQVLEEERIIKVIRMWTHYERI